MTDYSKRLILPQKSDGTPILFYTPSGLLVSVGYTRVAIGQRGPYVEFHDSQIQHNNIAIAEEKGWKLSHPLVYYWEYRSRDASYVKFYYQRWPVHYADYIPEMWYVSPFDLMSNQYQELVTKRQEQQLSLL